MSKNKIAIYGATGWLGQMTISYLMEFKKECDLTLISSDGRKILVNNKEFKTYTMNDFLNLNPKEFDYYLNYAFLTQDKISLMKDSEYLKKTDEIIKKEEEFYSKNTIQKALLISSGAVYWKNTDKENLYTIQKLNQENNFKEINNNFQTDYIVARIFSVLGNHFDLNSKYAFVSFVKNALINKSIFIESEMRVLRSYLYFDSLLKYFFETKDKNIILDAWNETLDIADLAKMIASIYKVPLKINDKYIESKEVDSYVSNDHYFQKKIGLSIKEDLLKKILLD